MNILPLVLLLAAAVAAGAQAVTGTYNGFGVLAVVLAVLAVVAWLAAQHRRSA